MQEPENRRDQKRGEPWLTVPQSARTPGRYRFGEPVPSVEAEEDDDEDLEFLSALARQAEREAAVQPREGRPGRARLFNVKADTALDVFRETTVEQPRPRVLRNVQVDPIEMDDLLEQLSTTAAALRRLRAA